MLIVVNIFVLPRLAIADRWYTSGIFEVCADSLKAATDVENVSAMTMD